MDIRVKVFILMWWEHKTFAIASEGYLVKPDTPPPSSPPKASQRLLPGRGQGWRWMAHITYVYYRISRHLWQSTSNLVRRGWFWVADKKRICISFTRIRVSLPGLGIYPYPSRDSHPQPKRRTKTHTRPQGRKVWSLGHRNRSKTSIK